MEEMLLEIKGKTWGTFCVWDKGANLKIHHRGNYAAKTGWRKTDWSSTADDSNISSWALHDAEGGGGGGGAAASHVHLETCKDLHLMIHIIEGAAVYFTERCSDYYFRQNFRKKNSLYRVAQFFLCYIWIYVIRIDLSSYPCCCGRMQTAWPGILKVRRINNVSVALSGCSSGGREGQRLNPQLLQPASEVPLGKIMNPIFTEKCCMKVCMNKYIQSIC